MNIKTMNTTQTIMSEIIWNIGDTFTTPKTGETLFTVIKVNNLDVEAYDNRSRSGVTGFMKNYITKVEKINKSQSEIEINKYDTLTKIVKQLESCNYENDVSCLKNNVAFISLRRMAGFS